MRRLASDIEELSEMLSGVKMEDVAQADLRNYGGMKVIRMMSQEEADALRVSLGIQKP